MRRGPALALRAAVFAAIAVAFLGSLGALLISGPIVVPRGGPLDLGVEISPARLRRDVERLAVELSPRHYQRTDNLDRAAAWIAGELAGAGLDVEVQDYAVEGRTFHNVIGYRRGIEPGVPVRILGAHYDAFGEFPGADDNASGVAALLELVRTLPPEPPRHGQVFVAFSTEEPPYFATPDMGSRHFVDLLRERGVEVEIMVALDLVGYFSDEPGSQRFPLPLLGLVYPRRGDFVAVVGDTGSGRPIRLVKQQLLVSGALPVHSFRALASIPGVRYSDHLSFRDRGLPGVLITDTAFYRNPHYHTAGDTPDTLDYVRMAELVRGLHGLFWDRDVAG